MRPRRDAVSRSMTTLDDKPEFCWSELTSAISGSVESLSRSFRPPYRQRVEIRRLQRVLVLRVALPPADAHVLGVLQEQGRPGHARSLAAQTGDHLVRGGLANPHGLELNVDLGRVPAAESAAAGARHHGDGFDIRVVPDLFLEPSRLLHQRLVGDVLFAHDGALQTPGVLLRERNLSGS